MENDELSSRPSLPFPLALALLLLLLLSISAFFFCCLHWDKLRSLIFSSAEDNQDHIQAELDQKPPRPNMKAKQNQQQSSPVLMPGDQVPKFIAIACPCKPPVMEKHTVIVQKPTHFCDAATLYV